MKLFFFKFFISVQMKLVLVQLHLLVIVYSIIVHEGMVFLENCYLGFFALFKKTKKEL